MDIFDQKFVIYVTSSDTFIKCSFISATEESTLGEKDVGLVRHIKTTDRSTRSIACMTFAIAVIMVHISYLVSD